MEVFASFSFFFAGFFISDQVVLPFLSRLFQDRHLMPNTVAFYRMALEELLQFAFGMDVTSAPFCKYSRAFFRLWPAHTPPYPSWSLD